MTATAKRCGKCGQTKAHAEFYRLRSGRPHSWCKVCVRVYEATRRPALRRAPPVPAGQQRCSGCKAVKPLNAFFRNRARPSGRAQYCKICFHGQSATARAYRKYRRGEKSRATIRRYARAYKKGYYRRPGEREKAALRRLTLYLVQFGLLRRQPCRVCEGTKVQAHHRSYEPLDVPPALAAALAEVLRVEWLCARHHGQHHRDPCGIAAQEVASC